MLAATLVDNLCEEIGWNLATYQTNIYWYACQLLKCPLSNSQCRPIVPNVHQPSGQSRPSDKGVGRSSRPWDKGGTSLKKFSQPFSPQFGLKIREGSPGSAATASANRYLANKVAQASMPIVDQYTTTNTLPLLDRQFSDINATNYQLPMLMNTTNCWSICQPTDWHALNSLGWRKNMTDA